MALSLSAEADLLLAKPLLPLLGPTANVLLLELLLLLLIALLLLVVASSAFIVVDVIAAVVIVVAELATMLAGMNSGASRFSEITDVVNVVVGAADPATGAPVLDEEALFISGDDDDVPLFTEAEDNAPRAPPAPAPATDDDVAECVGGFLVLPLLCC